MTQIEKQIAEIDKSKVVVPTSSTTISITAFELPAAAQQQIAQILSERRAAIQARTEANQQIVVAGIPK